MGDRMGASSRRDRGNSVAGVCYWRAGCSSLSELDQVCTVSPSSSVSAAMGELQAGRRTLLSLQITVPWAVDSGSLFQDSVSAWGCKHPWCDFELF